MEVKELGLTGVKLIVPTYFDDNRGYSTEAYNDRTLQEYGIGTKFRVDYECYNRLKGTIRGIHFQNNPHPQAKLVRVLRGEVLDFVVDLRRDSPTFKKWICQVISAENRKQLYLVRAIRWNDPELQLPWEIKDPVLSPSDEKAPLLKDSDINLTVEENS